VNRVGECWAGFGDMSIRVPDAGAQGTIWTARALLVLWSMSVKSISVSL
jgi:hypothetical protein